MVAFPPFLLSTHNQRRLDDEAEGDIKPCENRMYFNLQLEWNAHYLWMPTDWTVHSSPSDHMPSWRSLLHLTSVLASLWQPYYTASNGRCPMADVEFQPYLNYGKHKRTFLKRRTWTKSKIPTSYKNNFQQSPLKARLRRPATLATECSSPTTTAVESGQGGGGAVCLLLRRMVGWLGGGKQQADRDAEEFAFALIATKTEQEIQAEAVQLSWILWPETHLLGPKEGRLN